MTEVTVSTVDELLEAIAPETVITLKAGEYDLSKASTYGTEQHGDYWRWQDAYDGYELVIEGLSYLTIQGEGMDKVTISAVPRYATVLNFNTCNNITLKGFTAGHTEAPAFCAGNVLGFDNCRETTIDECGMFGCGVLGISAQNCTDMTVTDSVIYDCSYGAVYLYGTRNVLFDGCTIRDHAAAWTDPVSFLFQTDSCENIVIRNSVVKDNYAQCLLMMGYSRNVVFAGNKVEKNGFLSGVFSSYRNSPVVEGCSFTDNSINTWYEGSGVFAVDAEGRTLGREELEGMVQRTIGEDEALFASSGVNKEELVSPAADGAYHVNTVDEFLSVIGSDRMMNTNRLREDKAIEPAMNPRTMHGRRTINAAVQNSPRRARPFTWVKYSSGFRNFPNTSPNGAAGSSAAFAPDASPATATASVAAVVVFSSLMVVSFCW